MRPGYLDTRNEEGFTFLEGLAVAGGIVVCVVVFWLLFLCVEKDGYDRGFAEGARHERNKREETAEYEMGRLKGSIR